MNSTRTTNAAEGKYGRFSTSRFPEVGETDPQWWGGGTTGAGAGAARARARTENADFPQDQPETRKVRVVIYSDEPILTRGLQDTIADDPELQMTACCSSAADLTRRLTVERPDIAVIDFTPAVTSEALFAWQSAAIGCKFILWANSVKADFIPRAFAMGIGGVLRKSLPVEAHRECLHAVNSGVFWVRDAL